MPKVSVVVPAYNNAAYIEETIRSILDQTFDDFELIVADHSSSDLTLEVLQQFDGDPRLRLLTTPTGGGAESNWNRVSVEASGTYLKLVCGDDVLHRDGLRRQIEVLEAEPGAVMVASPRRIVDSDGRQLIGVRGLGGLHGTVPGAQAIRGLVRAGANIFGEPVCVTVRRSALESVGGWDARFPFVIDQTTYVKVLELGSLAALPDVVADFRVSPSQWSVALSRDQYKQVSQFHHWVSQRHPETVSRADVQLGNARARAAAYGRRAVYWGLSRRRLRSIS